MDRRHDTMTRPAAPWRAPRLLATLPVLAALWTAPATAQQPPATGPAVPEPTLLRQVEAVTEYRLPNGLTVLLAPDASKATTTVNLTYRVGSRHEGYGESGAAHLLEHMLFKSSATVQDPKFEMTRRGARWNGTTWYDRTNYFAQFASHPETLDWMLGWLAEAMTQARISEAELATEMTVVRNEFERNENLPGRVLAGRMRSAAFQWHAYGRDTIGARSDIEKLPIERLRAFYRRHYRPDNAVLVIGGHFDVPAALRRTAEAFGAIARPAAPLEATWTQEPVQDGERHVSLRRVGGSGAVAVLYHVMPGNTPDFAAVRVLAQMLNHDRGPIGRALVATGMAATQWASATATLEPGFLSAGAGLVEGADADAAAAQAVAVLARTLENLVVHEGAVQTAKAQLLQGLRSTERDPEALSLALSESVALGDWRLWYAMRDWIEAVTPADVQRVARSWLVASNRTSGSYVAVAQLPQRAPPAAAIDVAALLKDYAGKAVNVAVEDFPLTPENIQARLVQGRLQAGGEPGLRFAVLPRRTKDDRVTGTLRLRWGTADSLQGTSVLSTMLAPLLNQGTRQRDADNIARALLGMEAQLRFASSAGVLTASFELPARQLPAFTALLAELLQQPTFPDAAFERNQRAMLSSLQGIKADTGAVAANALQRIFNHYPEGDPREPRSHARTEALMRSASAAELRALWQRFGGASHGELALLGPVQPDEVRALFQQHLGGWKSAEPRRPWQFAYPAVFEPQQQSLLVPDKANANYAARIPLSMDDDAPDFVALNTGVQLLGGRAGTALWRRVREQEGLSYGISASLFVPAASPSEGRAAAINIQASFAPQNRDRLRAAILDELALRAASGFSPLEVAFASRAIVSARADALAQPANLVGLLANNLRWARSMERYGRTTEAYAQVDAEAVNAALRRYLDPQRLVEVTAGSFAD